MEGRVLLVDDEKLTRATLEPAFRDEGFQVLCAANGFEALAKLADHRVDVVVTDLRMPSMGGLELHRAVREQWPDTAVLFLTAFGSVATAVEAMREGAADYLSKPVNAEELIIRVRRLIQRQRDVAEIRELRESASPLDGRQGFGGLIYRSRLMARVVERALSVADTDVTVLIEGGTGTGKEVLGRAVHEKSQRSGGPFVVVNCAGLNPNLVESELFGHEVGAFTGATRLRQGRIECADRGTLLIDEVDDLSPEIQVRLLRFLQDHSFERVGSSRTMKANVRVLAATKRSLSDLVRAGRFREDLFYRMNTVVIAVPPLAARPEDIGPLAEHFTRRASAARGSSEPPILLPETLQILVSHPWPGNVRELEHAIEHAVMFSRGGSIEPRHLPSSLLPQSPPELVTLRLEGLDTVSYAELVAACERRLLDWALARTHGNQARAAELLQLSRTTFRGRLAALKNVRDQAENSEGGSPLDGG